jgi:hypothetical protein
MNEFGPSDTCVPDTDSSIYQDCSAFANLGKVHEFDDHAQFRADNSITYQLVDFDEERPSGSQTSKEPGGDVSRRRPATRAMDDIRDGPSYANNNQSIAMSSLLVSIPPIVTSTPQ